MSFGDLNPYLTYGRQYLTFFLSRKAALSIYLLTLTGLNANRGTTVHELNIQYCTLVKKVNYEESLCNI